ncbi:hypothetical protein [Cohnella soli]|uniref:Uncharacterized protein n=1 Tax=Cohnella soli TaxID=425005 RepID=A0ABW0I1B8_9BACL
MIFSILIVILVMLVVGVVFQRAFFNNKIVGAPKQASLPLKKMQAKTDVEVALEYEAYKQKKETSVSLLQRELKDDQRRSTVQIHNDLENIRNEIQSKLTHFQNENQMHTKKANEKMHDWIKDLLQAQRKELHDFFQKTNNNIKLEIKSEIQSSEQQIQREIRIVKQFVKEEIQKAILKTTSLAAPKPESKATVAGMPEESLIGNLTKHLNIVELTENQLQTNVFKELNHQLVDAQNTMKQIQDHLETLNLLHALECEINQQALSMSE